MSYTISKWEQLYLSIIILWMYIFFLAEYFITHWCLRLCLVGLVLFCFALLCFVCLLFVFFLTNNLYYYFSLSLLIFHRLWTRNGRMQTQIPLPRRGPADDGMETGLSNLADGRQLITNAHIHLHTTRSHTHSHYTPTSHHYTIYTYHVCTQARMELIAWRIELSLVNVGTGVSFLGDDSNNMMIIVCVCT